MCALLQDGRMEETRKAADIQDREEEARCLPLSLSNTHTLHTHYTHTTHTLHTQHTHYTHTTHHTPHRNIARAPIARRASVGALCTRQTGQTELG